MKRVPAEQCKVLYLRRCEQTQMTTPQLGERNRQDHSASFNTNGGRRLRLFFSENVSFP